MTDFEYYIDCYGGVEISDSDEFERCFDKAKRFVKHITYCEPDFEDDDVRSCLCALSEVYMGVGASNIVREKIDGYEAEYGDGADKEILLHTAKLYLPPMLLYRGF
ncbi:MAG: hypothetical protein Q4B31_02920 [Clostridia bacterium]|nr:hypothetical protein [Clostridia bacterium]